MTEGIDQRWIIFGVGDGVNQRPQGIWQRLVEPRPREAWHISPSRRRSPDEPEKAP